MWRKHALPTGIVGIGLPLAIRPCLRHPILGVVVALALAAVGVVSQIACNVVRHRVAGGRGQTIRVGVRL